MLLEPKEFAKEVIASKRAFVAYIRLEDLTLNKATIKAVLETTLLVSYSNYTNMFSKKEASTLLVHSPYNYPINLDRGKAPFSFIYNLLANKLEIL